jgi:hypothetical protein
LESEVLVQADRLVGRKDAVLVINDTAMPKNVAIERRRAASLRDILGSFSQCRLLLRRLFARRCEYKRLHVKKLDRVTCRLGKHEHMLLSAFESGAHEQRWLHNGGSSLSSY